ncbi:MAG: hypothetical protein IJF69_03170 [Clostridia bacterium]|nr:hypothetical protein [Clostridia bacterium]
MKSTKIIALLLAALLCLPLLAACAGDSNTENTRPVKDGGSSDVGFASGDFKNEEFTFLFIKHTDIGKDYYGGNYLDSDGLTGATIEDTVYKRNMAVEEKYKVVINERVEISGDPAALLQTFYMTGDFSFDVIYGWGYKLGACIPENYFTDFKSLPNVNLDEEYWSPSAIEELTVNDKLYLCINDISMNKLEWAGFLFYNKQVAEDYNVNTSFGSFYDLVREGKWTLDTYLKVVSSVSNDLDGDGKITKDDVYGLIDGDGVGLGLGASCGMSYATKADDGSYLLNYYNEKTLDIANKIRDVYSNGNYVKNFEDMWQNADYSGYTDQWEYARSFFARDHALFCAGSAYITGEFRDMESEYGIIPFPKYDENQENYISTISHLASIFALPSTYRNNVSTAGADRTGIILEYMAYKSQELLLPQYYDTLLKGQRLNSPDDQEMLDIIRKTVRYEFTDMMGIEDIAKNCEAVYKNPNTASSTYNRQSKKLQKQLDDFYTELLLLGSKG